MWKVVGPVNVKKIYAKCGKKFGRLHDQSDGQFGQFGRPGQFFSGIFGFRGVNISKVKNPGKCHDLKAKIESLSIDTHQLHYNPLHHFII